jgi:hypothetical protein
MKLPKSPDTYLITFHSKHISARGLVTEVSNSMVAGGYGDIWIDLWGRSHNSTMLGAHDMVELDGDRIGIASIVICLISVCAMHSLIRRHV